MCMWDCSVRRARRDGSGCCDDRDMQITAMVETVNAELRAAWQLEKRLHGGLNTGAYLVAQPNGDRAVLKWRSDDPERMLAAAPIVAAARARGWPAPAWLAVGAAPSGEAWVLQQ